MVNTPQSEDNDDLRFRDDIDEVFSRANPNPDRIGCPPRDTLVALARRQQPLGDPAYEHLAKCSPCYREFRALQADVAGSGASPARRTRPWALAALVAGLTIAIAGIWWFSSRPQPSQVTSVPGGAELRAEVDLRRFAVLRSEQAQNDAQPVALPSGVVELTLLLPVGSEPGVYDVRVLDSDLQSRSEAAGEGIIENFVTTVRVRMDLQLQPGRYQLAVRRQGDSWRLFPAEVR